MKKLVLIVISSAVALALTAGAITAVLAWQFLKSSPSQDETEIVYEVRPGAGFNTVAKELQEKGLIQDASLFKFFVKFRGQGGNLKVGEYLLRPNMTPSEVLSTITSGKSVARSFTVSEGLSTYEIAALLEKNGIGNSAEFMRLVRDPVFVQSLLGEERESLEGYLFPETYMVTKYTDMKSLVTNMVKRFLAVYSELEEKNQYVGLTRHRLVTLASIIEKETGAPEERPLISSVFHNRLARGMRLQTDPTVIYGKAESLGRIVISITRKDLQTPTRYNTYLIPGLPPGPIANPGKEALDAAMKPQASKYIFFVSQNDGTHVFTEKYQDHLKAVRKFQLDARARKGKSWRDLNKRNTDTKR